MNLKRYIQFRVRRIIDAAEVPADLVSNREKLLDKMLTLWYKWKKSVERETKALVSDFKKTEKSKKEPPRTLLSKADKLYKSIQPVCLAYAKVNQKLQSGNPTSSEMSKIGLSGKVVPIPRGVKGDDLLRSINRNKIPAEDFGGFETSGMQQGIASVLAPYYNVATKTLSTKLAAASEEEKLAKPQMTPRAPIMAEPEKPNISNSPEANIKNFKSSYDRWFSQIESAHKELHSAYMSVFDLSVPKEAKNKAKAVAARALNTFSDLTAAFPLFAKLAKGILKKAFKSDAQIRWESWLFFVSKKFGVPVALLEETEKTNIELWRKLLKAGYTLVPEMYANIDNIVYITADLSPSQAADFNKLKEIVAKTEKLEQQSESMLKSISTSSSREELMEIKNKAEKGVKACRDLAEKAKSLRIAIGSFDAESLERTIQFRLLGGRTSAGNTFDTAFRKAEEYIKDIDDMEYFRQSKGDPNYD